MTHFKHFALLILLILAGHSPLFAQQEDVAVINNAGQAYSGNTMLNQAAGNHQQQINARAISAGDQAVLQLQQEQDANLVPEHLNARAEISGASFSQGSGVLGVNQSSGMGNQQINAFRLSVGAFPESLDDSSLAQSAAPLSHVSGVEAPIAGERRVEMDGQSFAGSRGVVQLNQSAGVGNRMINHLGIRVTP